MLIDLIFAAALATASIDSLPIPEEVYFPESITCSCIETARALGVPIPSGTDADDLDPNAPMAEGNLALFSYDSVDHVAVVDAVFDYGIWIKEGNYEECEYTERYVPLSDPRLKGFFQQKTVHS